MRATKILIMALLFLASIGCASICRKDTLPLLRGTELRSAVLSPDGQTIVVSVDSKSGCRLYKGRTDGSGFVPITNDGERVCAHDPVFSPDGTKIIFSHISEGHGDICEINIDGTGKRCLTSGKNHDDNPVYSPDGSKVYFLRAKVFTHYSPIALPGWHDADIYSMNADGTNVSQITSERNYHMSSLSISPQGEALLIMGSALVDPIWIISLADPTNKKSVRPDLDKYRKRILWVYEKDVDYKALRNPQFSPDGRKILFSWPYNDELYVMDRETNIAEPIWKPAGSEKRWPSRMYPRYSPDGQRIIFSTAKRVEVSICDSDFAWTDAFGMGRVMPELWIVNADGTGLQSVDVKSEGR